MATNYWRTLRSANLQFVTRIADCLAQIEAVLVSVLSMLAFFAFASNFSFLIIWTIGVDRFVATTDSPNAYR